MTYFATTSKHSANRWAALHSSHGFFFQTFHTLIGSWISPSDSWNFLEMCKSQGMKSGYMEGRKSQLRTCIQEWLISNKKKSRGVLSRKHLWTGCSNLSWFFVCWFFFIFFIFTLIISWFLCQFPSLLSCHAHLYFGVLENNWPWMCLQVDVCTCEKGWSQCCLYWCCSQLLLLPRGCVSVLNKMCTYISTLVSLPLFIHPSGSF